MESFKLAPVSPDAQSGHKGLTKREDIAARVLAGLVIAEGDYSPNDEQISACAAKAVRYADELEVQLAGEASLADQVASLNTEVVALNARIEELQGGADTVAETAKLEGEIADLQSQKTSLEAQLGDARKQGGARSDEDQKLIDTLTERVKSLEDAQAKPGEMPGTVIPIEEIAPPAPERASEVEAPEQSVPTDNPVAPTVPGEEPLQ